MPRPVALASLVALGVVPLGLTGQSRAAELIDSARAQLSAHHPDSAAALLGAALDTAVHATPAERQSAHVWTAVSRYMLGDDAGARAAFRQAFALDTALDVKGLERLSPELAQLFLDEKRAAVRRGFLYLWENVDEQPRRLSAPPVAYPVSLLRRHVRGTVEVGAIVDTLGRAEPRTVEVFSAPDSALINPVKEMMLAARFSPGRVKGSAVRVMIRMGVEVHPPRLSATELVGQARNALGAGRPDTATALLDLALDSALTHPTEGEQVYALLVRGIAASRAGRDSVARADLGDAEARYAALSARGVDLAPFLRRLADSVRRARAPSHGAPFPAPTVIGAVDEAPVLVSHPTIRYPPEMQALRIGGTVVVEVMVDASGRVEPGSATIAETPNHAFDAEALRVVNGSLYRPARSKGRPARVRIRQPIGFVNY
ncbi:MAG TPA: energy transducer TonB [Gemmatimonadales bacterium]|nr:energy transducer TonB [Gemmatimonadales bacterium]